MDLALPLAMIVAASVGLAYAIEPIPSWYFLLLWWPYVLGVDALGRRLGGRSLLRDRPGELVRLSLVSVVWWTLFEALNLRLGNWYYVMVLEDPVTRWLFGFAAFASVLPGVVVTERLLERLRIVPSLRVPALAWSVSRQRALLALGSFCLCAPLVWPETFYPLTWGSFALLLAPWNRGFATRSFLRDLERGEAAPLARTLLAGLVCGVVWESGNQWARQKWVYTVPGLEQLKLFEMPLLGYLGFPAFAVECLVVLRFLDWLPRATAGWPARRRRLVTRAAIALATAGTLVVFWVSEPITNDSFYVPLARLGLLSGDERQAFARSGIESPEQFLRRAAPTGGIERLGALTGIGPERLRELDGTFRLLTHCGLGARRLAQLEALGIHRVEDLRSWSAAELAAALESHLGPEAGPFLLRRARVWIEDVR